MAYIRKIICAYPNCKNYAEKGSSMCVEHKRTINRGTTSKFEKLYKTKRWETERKHFLLQEENHYCKECLKRGRYTPAELPHHSEGFSDYNSFFDKSKWIAWCKSCHSSYHTKYTNEDLWNIYHGGKK